jgi:hypothetical protein
MLQILHVSYPTASAIAALVAAPGSMILDQSGPNF